MARESYYQAGLRKRIEDLFPGCVILKNDANLLQGVPDLVILWRDKWAMLEVKESAHAVEQPNQSYYIKMFNHMSFAAFIFPENEEEVLNDLQQVFRAKRPARSVWR